MKRKVWLYCINSYLVARTVGDWIQVKRMEKNLTPGHLAAKKWALQRLWFVHGKMAPASQMAGGRY